MPLTKVQFRPGITSDVTSYTNEGGWFNGDKIRFRLGFPEKIGGWTKQSSNTYQGSARDLLNWVALDGSNFLGLGTELKYYIEEGGAFSDITPLCYVFWCGVSRWSCNCGYFKRRAPGCVRY